MVGCETLHYSTPLHIQFGVSNVNPFLESIISLSGLAISPTEMLGGVYL